MFLISHLTSFEIPWAACMFVAGVAVGFVAAALVWSRSKMPVDQD